MIFYNISNISKISITVFFVLLATSCKAPGFEWQASEAFEQVGGEWRSPSTPGEPAMLVSMARYRNFILEIEFNPDVRVNSGVFVRCQDPADITANNCYEANIWDQHPRQEFRTGSIVMRFAPPLVHVATINKWNSMQIKAIDDLVEVRVNGVMTARLEDADLSEGYLALQWGGEGHIRFRNISLQTL